VLPGLTDTDGAYAGTSRILFCDLALQAFIAFPNRLWHCQPASLVNTRAVHEREGSVRREQRPRARTSSTLMCDATSSCSTSNRASCACAHSPTSSERQRAA
jgi:hypothetical protein